MNKLFKISLVVLICLVFLFALATGRTSEDVLKVYVLDVGQGDGILIRTPSGHNIVIDGGPDNSFIQKIGKHLPFYDREIDLVILTHPHDDHVFGLVELFNRYKINNVIATKVVHKTDAYRQWLSQIDSKKIPLAVAFNGQELVFKNDCRVQAVCQENEVVLKILYPFASFEGNEAENLNNTSVVARLTYGQSDWLFTGDLEKEGEQELLENDWSKSLLDVEVLKVGHHGSKTSSSRDFLAAVSPEIAVISVGAKNKFGHPSIDVLKSLEAFSAQIMRTDEEGDILLKVTSKNFIID